MIRSIKRFDWLASLLLLATVLMALLWAGLVAAVTPNAQPGMPVYVVPLHLSGQYTADTVGVAKFKLPYAAKLLGVSAAARASGGTSPTLAVDVQEAGTTVLSAPISLTAGTVAEGGIADASLADEALITVDFDTGGTNPTWNDITVLLTLARK